MALDRLQTQRFELKYQISEATALAVRQFVRSYLEPDEFGATPEAPWYPVHSLYLDSPDFALCHATLNGDRNRFKLRVRYYNDDPAAPMFFEIKRRVDRCIHKQRAFVRRECAAALLAGELPRLRHLARADAKGFAALNTFTELQRRLHAGPCAHVAYEREAWVSSGHNAVRVTVDRAVRCETVRQPHLATAFTTPSEVFPGRAILEIKFTNRFPDWLAAMVSQLSLRQSGAAKYADGVVRCQKPTGAASAAAPATPGVPLGRRRPSSSGAAAPHPAPVAREEPRSHPFVPPLPNPAH